MNRPKQVGALIGSTRDTKFALDVVLFPSQASTDGWVLDASGRVRRTAGGWTRGNSLLILVPPGGPAEVIKR